MNRGGEVEGDDPRLVLARRLRDLRTEQWTDARITQLQVAQALDKSVSLISSWESQGNPTIPPLPQLESYAQLFAVRRSLAGDALRLLGREEVSDEEGEAIGRLRKELLELRGQALAAGRPSTVLQGAGPVATAQLGQVAESLSAGPWRFEDGDAITVACAQWPPELLKDIPYTKVDDPDYIELMTFSELDSLVELYGHLRAANPASDVVMRVQNKLHRNDYSSHLVTLGGIDWNKTTSSLMRKLGLPVRQIADWSTEGGQYFEVNDNGKITQFRPVLEASDSDKKVLVEDIALFVRAVSPYNQERTVTICYGMYGRGTYGAVRALTDKHFRDRNAAYLESQFGESLSYCILTRVQIENGETLTPDWAIAKNRLYEWAQ